MNESRSPNDRLAEITRWLTHRVAAAVHVPSEKVDVDRDLGEYGLDSVVGLEVVADLEDLVGHRLPDTLLLDFRSIAAVAREVTAREHPDLREHA